MTFKELKLHPSLLKAIDEAKYVSPTPIQQQAIPLILNGNDVLGCAQTGTGKTASYVLPILQQLFVNKATTKAPQCLIMAPTRELVLQISETITSYTKYLPIKHVNLFGGQSVHNQRSKMQTMPQIIVATPGRLLDFLQSKFLDARQIKHFVLDEADQMLDMGFVKDIKKVIQFLPKEKQTLLLSATMPKEIEEFAQTILRKPQKVTVEKVSSTVKTVEQLMIYTDKQSKTPLLEKIIKEKNDDRCIVFVRTKYGADKLVKQLAKLDVHAQAIHGNKSQNSRINTLESFKKRQLKILIATDIAARGIDIEQLPLVINYELPQVPETYVHRIGRTGRAGHTGLAISFCSEEETKELNQIQKLIGITIPSDRFYTQPLEAKIVVDHKPKEQPKTQAKRKPYPKKEMRNNSPKKEVRNRK